MRLKYLLPFAALLLLAGCQKEPALATESMLPTNSETAIVSDSTVLTTESGLPVSSETVTETDSPETPPAETTVVTEATQAPTETTSSQPAPTEPNHTDPPKPTEPKPTEPKPTDPPKPTEPKPTEPKPTDPPKPSEPAHVHSYKSTVIAPTCTAKGYTEHKCSCGDSYKDSYTDALGHSMKEQTVAATCTAGGYTQRTCSRCGATEKTNTTPALGHDYKDTVVPPTTTSEGYTEHKCSRCGDSYRDNYTPKIKETFDIQAVMDYGNAYAQSLGFTIDYSLNMNNSGYYPGYNGGGYSLDFLKREAKDIVQYTYDSLLSFEETIDGFRGRVLVTYNSETDKYRIVFLYG